ncbi:MAG: amidase family protein [Candidatus Nanopelagicales bacterium]
MSSTDAASADPHAQTADLSRLGADPSGARVTSTELVGALIERIAAVDAPDSPTALRAVLALADDALDTARARDAERAAGRSRGPLHGVPVLVKDNIQAVGLPCTAGSASLLGRPVTVDAPLVARLREAGAVVLGATNLSEWANLRSTRSASGWSGVGGLTGNPWALDRSAGGSSAGAGAAVAAGLAPLAVGTETNGSITCPAALNGVVGLKPTVGSIPGAGIVPLSRSQDTAGPMARSVREAAVLFAVLSGRVDALRAGDPERARTMTVGVSAGLLTGDAATDGLFSRTVDQVARVVAEVRDVDVPGPDGDVVTDQTSVLVAEHLDDLATYLAERPGGGIRGIADVIAFDDANPELERASMGQDLLQLAVDSGGRRGPSYRTARERNLQWARSTLGAAFASGVDVVMAPAYRPAWKSDLVHGDVLMGGGAVCTAPAILGWPILTVPMGLVGGLPVGLSICGPAGSEDALLAIGQAVEDALGLVAGGGFRPTWRRPERG